jgi:hypothetical protein
MRVPAQRFGSLQLVLFDVELDKRAAELAELPKALGPELLRFSASAPPLFVLQWRNQVSAQVRILRIPYCICIRTGENQLPALIPTELVTRPYAKAHFSGEWFAPSISEIR